MNRRLWLLQIALAVYFLITGILHFAVPPGLPGPMVWMYDLDPRLHTISGTAEILAAFGLILPGWTAVRTGLTPLAAAGLVLVMILAAVFHATRGEYLNIGMNAILAAIAGFVAYGRWRIAPLPGRDAAGATADQ